MIINTKEILKNADLSILDEELKEIISLRYDSNGNVKRTAGEVARILGKYYTAIPRLEKKAFMILASQANIKVINTHKKHLSYKEMVKKTQELEKELGFRWGNEYIKEFKW